MYYLFIIKNDFLKDYDEEYLYNILKKLKMMNKKNYNYGISLYYNICNLFNIKVIKHYIKCKTNLEYKNNKFYLNKADYFEIRKSCIIINSEKYLRQILCIFYIYNKNIFVCNFDNNKYFWIKDKLSV